MTAELSREVAPDGATCPGCGMEVGGWRVGRTAEGRTTWDRPTRWLAGPSGREDAQGGLTHVEGGVRCVAGGIG